MATYIIVSIIAYLLGSISFSVIFSKKLAGFDVREKGSGNAGTTNVLRTVGKKAAALTLLCDCLKGVFAVLVAFIAGKIVKDTDSSLLVQLAGIFVVLGHTFPVFFKFKGGKGVATSLGVLLITNWQIGLICLVFALILMALTRFVSLGSIAAAILFPVLTVFIHENYLVPGNYVIFAIIMAVLVVFNHRSNVKRLLEGKENKLSFKKLANEFSLYDKKRFIIAAFSWSIMLISSVKAYEYGSVSVVAPLLTLSMITNTIYEYIFDKNKKDLLFKLFISFLIIIGVILIKM